MVGGAASAVAFSIVANECHKLIRLLRYAASVGRHYMTIRFGGSAFSGGLLAPPRPRPHPRSTDVEQ